MRTLGKENFELRAARYDNRSKDPFLDRRSGEDRRFIYCLEYFLQGNPDRRTGAERRKNLERRHGFVRVSRWSSACPDYDEKEWVEGCLEL